MTIKNIKNLQKSICVCAVVAMALSACQPHLTREDPQVVVSPDRTDLMLADAATRATKALESLASLEQAKNPNAGDIALPDAPTELRRSITLNWNGPVEPVARLLADRAGYKFQAIGAPPPTGLLVQVDARAEPVVSVLRSIGLQMGNRAILKVNPNTRVVEIQYAPASTVNITNPNEVQ